MMPRGGIGACRGLLREHASTMHFDGHDPGNTDCDAAFEPLAAAPLDAAESTWDPWLRALYLREIEAERQPALH